MKHTIDRATELGFEGFASLDTSLVLFFLALEYGRAVQMYSLDGVLMGTTILMVLLIPYFLPSNTSNSGLVEWLIRRTLITGSGVLLGYALKQSLGAGIPEALRFMPMTFLILASMVSCYIQFYGLMKLRLAK